MQNWTRWLFLLGILCAFGNQEALAADRDPVAAIAAELNKCWIFNTGSRAASDLIVRVHVLLNRDGSVAHADVVDDPRLYSDKIFRSAADTARRAIYACSPVRLPPDKYDALKDLVFTFDPASGVK